VNRFLLAFSVFLPLALAQAELTAALDAAVAEAETGFMPGVYALMALMVTMAVGFALVSMMRGK
jgi:hypothetical protein